MMNEIPVAAVVAMDQDRVFGRAGGLPWHVPEDLAHFRNLTKGHIVVMGRKTWESLPEKFRPLPGRTNVVVSRDVAKLHLPEGVIGASSPQDALSVAKSLAREGQRVWIIGGVELYRATLPFCAEVHLTVIDGSHEGDAWLPPFEADFKQISEHRGERCSFRVYSRAA
jgi:dihydrofolate reductase